MIKTKLLIATLLCAIVALIFGGFFAFSSWQAAQARRSENRVTQIVEAISQLRSLTFEYLLSNEQSSLQQWQVENTKISSLLKPMAYFDQSELSNLRTISETANQSQQLFNQIADNVAAASESSGAQMVVRDDLVTQLLLNQQTEVAHALNMASHAQAIMGRFDYRSTVLGASVIVLALCIGAINYVFVTRIITLSLRGLQNGAEAIARGRFDYRIEPRNHRDEFGRVAAAFNAMAVRTGHIDKEKTEFILLASHQLRTPLTAMRWYAESLADQRTNLDDDKRRSYAQQVLSSSKRMIDLVDKLLNAARVEAGSLHSQPEQIELRKVLEQAMQDVEQEIRANSIHVETHIDANISSITVDPSWIRVILQNLLSNAVRYSRYGEHVSVRIKRDGEAAVICVADKGYGIPAAEQNRVFTKLFRAENAKQIIGEGSGIGLYIAKAMVDRAGGKIWFDSAENKGTKFFVKLPLHSQAASANIADAPSAGTSLDETNSMQAQAEPRQSKHENDGRDFISLVAHQLRTLPNIIAWDIEALLDKSGSKLNNMERRALRHISEVNQRMVALIDTMLNISRVELGTLALTPERFDLKACVEDELVIVRQSTQGNGPRITTSYPRSSCLVEADKSLVQVIAQNLLSNAVKYTPASGTVRLSVQKLPGRLRVRVADSGCGIPEAEQAHVFTKLFRANNVRGGDISGNGLGLYLTKRLVDLLHGSITFTSAENQGTTFVFELPRHNVRSQEGSTKLTMPGQTIPAHIQGGTS